MDAPPTPDYSHKAVPTYVTHTVCDSIVDISVLGDGNTLVVYCPTCDDIVKADELSEEECYLVAKPQ